MLATLGHALLVGVSHADNDLLIRLGLMATRKQQPDEVVEDQGAGDELGPSGVRPLEQEPDDEVDYQGVDEVGPAPMANEVTRTDNFFSGPSSVTEVVEYEPEVIEGDEQTYRIRLTQDLEPIFIGIDHPVPAMRKDVLYEVSQRIYDYLLPRGLIQGK